LLIEGSHSNRVYGYNVGIKCYHMSEAPIFYSSRQNSTLELSIVPLMAVYIVKESCVRQAPYGEDTLR
jgi:hypothetical protein